ARPMLRVALPAQVDAADAVEGNLAGGVAGSPSDAANKQVLDIKTNVHSKNNRISTAPRNPRSTVSIAESPEEAMSRFLTGRFSEVEEIRVLAERAAKRTRVGLRTNGTLTQLMRKDPTS